MHCVLFMHAPNASHSGATAQQACPRPPHGWQIDVRVSHRLPVLHESSGWQHGCPAPPQATHA
jgi:hypothetical protein